MRSFGRSARFGYGAALSRFAAERPEAWIYVASAACWTALVLIPADAPATPFCVGGGDRLAALSFAAGAAFDRFEWPLALWHWLLMIGAMMLPMAAMAARHVAFRSFRQRRARAMLVFLLGYVLVWMAVAPLYLLARLGVHVLAPDAVLLPLGVALALAAAWQGTGAKRRALRQCHKTVPLAPSGWRADRACFAFGLVHGRYCLIACWALMLIPVVAGHHPALMLVVAAAGLLERRSIRPRPERSARPLAGAALLCLALPAAGAAMAAVG